MNTNWNLQGVVTKESVSSQEFSISLSLAGSISIQHCPAFLYIVFIYDNVVPQSNKQVA